MKSKFESFREGLYEFLECSGKSKREKRSALFWFFGPFLDPDWSINSELDNDKTENEYIEYLEKFTGEKVHDYSKRNDWSMRILPELLLATSSYKQKHYLELLEIRLQQEERQGFKELLESILEDYHDT